MLFEGDIVGASMAAVKEVIGVERRLADDDECYDGPDHARA